jgi:hypothetical protein
MFQKNSYRGIQNTNFMLIIFFSENRAFYEIMLKSMVEPDRPDDNIIRRMRIACWITNATNALRIFNTYYFSMEKIVKRKRISVTLFVHRLSYLCIIIGINSDRLKAEVTSSE